MEDNSKLYSAFSTVVNTVRECEQRLDKYEQLLLTTFTYLYNRTDEVFNSIPQDSTNELTKQIEELNKNFLSFKEHVEKEFKNISQQIVPVNVAKEIEKNSLKKSIKKHKKHPWYWIFIKKKEYKKLLEKKHQLEEEIEQRRLERLAEQERQRKLQEEKDKERRRLEEEKRQKRREEAQKQMASILNKIKHST